MHALFTGYVLLLLVSPFLHALQAFHMVANGLIQVLKLGSENCWQVGCELSHRRLLSNLLKK